MRISKFSIMLILTLISILIIWCSIFKEYFENNSQKVCIVQFDTRAGKSKDIDDLCSLNNNICSKDVSCQYYFSNDTLGISPYWAKVKHVQHVLNNSNYEYVIWLDTDAIINLPKNLKLIDFIKNYIDNKDMMVSGDMPPWEPGPFNAGVWVVKNNEKGKEIIKEWLDLYDHSLWKQDENGNWSCPNQTWATCPGYEQGCFNKIMDKYSDNIKLVSWKIINNPLSNQLEINQKGVIHHFAGEHKTKIRDYLEKQL